MYLKCSCISVASIDLISNERILVSWYADGQ